MQIDFCVDNGKDDIDLEDPEDVDHEADFPGSSCATPSS